jgi:ectoine hydroxylase-related dioxygenase (phytanoyl-CoA dioxygenase family)
MRVGFILFNEYQQSMKANSYGVTQQVQVSDSVGLALEEIHIKGYTVLKQVFSAVELAECRQRLDRVYLQQEQHLGHDTLLRINELNLARCPLAYDAYFLHLATHERVLAHVEKILGHYYILHLQNGIINRPNEAHHQSSWHRDLPYQNFVISKPLAVNALWCIDPYNPLTGATEVLPFSHREESVPSEQFVTKHAVSLLAEPGDVVMFDSMLFHRAGYNSSEIIRRAINHVYTAPILKQQIDLPRLLGDQYINDLFLVKFLGYESQIAESDVIWRERRLQKLSKV